MPDFTIQQDEAGWNVHQEAVAERFASLNVGADGSWYKNGEERKLAYAEKLKLNEEFGRLGERDHQRESWSSWMVRGFPVRGNDGLFPVKSPYQDEADELGVPVIPALPEEQGPRDPNPVVAICGACGRKVHQVEMYSCSKGNCPIQPRASF